MLRVLRYVALPAGFALAVWFVWKNNPAELLARARDLGWLWAPALAGSFFWNGLFTEAWRELIPRTGEGRPSFRRLYMIRQGGETINYITPLGTVGGEPVKVMLLDVPPSVGSASVVAARTFHGMGQITYGLTCLLILLGTRSSEGVAVPLFIAAGLVATGLFLFVLIQKAGVLGRITRWFQERRGGAEGAAPGSEERGKLVAGLVRTSDELQRYYESPGGVVAPYLLFLLGWVATSLEPIVVLYALGLEQPVLNGVLITGLISLISTAAVVVPASLGVMEGGLVGVFNLLGLDPVMALTVVVVRRVRELTWVAIGMSFLWLLKRMGKGGASRGATPRKGVGMG